jgi:Family of unknown function (DUF5723)
MMRILKKNLLLVLLMICPTFLLAQQVNTLYFMENLPSRNMYNPAFQPINDLYISLPVIGYTQLSFGNNSVALKDLMYKSNGQFVTSLYDLGGKYDLYQKIKPTFLMNANVQVNLLTIGFRNKSSFWTFSINEKMDASVTLPKDLFKFALFGVDNVPSQGVQEYDERSVPFDFSGLKVDMTAYTEFALGYAKDVNEQWSVGGKVKFLYGNFNMSNVNKSTVFEPGPESTTMRSTGSINTSVPFPVTYSPNLLPISYDQSKASNPASYVVPSGLGAGLDLGFDFWANDDLSLSLAVNDLGFISWTNANNVNYNTNLNFTGVANQTGFDNNNFLFLTNLFSGSTLQDSLLVSLKSTQTVSKKPYTTFTTAKLNGGIEYKVFDNNASIGLLSRTYFGNLNTSEEITTSFNLRPADWINASLSYSFLNGNFSNIGFGIGLQTWIFHWFFAADYIPTYLYKAGGLPIVPAGTGTFNVAMGMNLIFNYPSEAEIAAKQKQNKDDKYGCPSCNEKLPVKSQSFIEQGSMNHSQKLRNSRKTKAFSKQQELPTYNRKTEPMVSPMYGR